MDDFLQRNGLAGPRPRLSCYIIVKVQLNLPDAN